MEASAFPYAELELKLSRYYNCQYNLYVVLLILMPWWCGGMWWPGGPCPGGPCCMGWPYGPAGCPGGGGPCIWGGAPGGGPCGGPWGGWCVYGLCGDGAGLCEGGAIGLGACGGGIGLFAGEGEAIFATLCCVYVVPNSCNWKYNSNLGTQSFCITSL